MRTQTLKYLILGCLLLLPMLGACRSAPAGKPNAATLSERSCSTNEQCAQGEFCAKLFGSCGESGRCEPQPKDCVEHGHVIDKPVCGCDGKTYGNYCLAAVAGVNVKSEGACTAP